MTFAVGKGHGRSGSQLSRLLVPSPNFDLGQVEHGLNDRGKLNVLLGLHSGLHVPSFSFFCVPKTTFWSTKFFHRLTIFLLLLTLQELLYFSCLAGQTPLLQKFLLVLVSGMMGVGAWGK